MTKIQEQRMKQDAARGAALRETMKRFSVNGEQMVTACAPRQGATVSGLHDTTRTGERIQHAAEQFTVPATPAILLRDGERLEGLHDLDRCGLPVRQKNDQYSVPPAPKFLTRPVK